MKEYGPTEFMISSMIKAAAMPFETDEARREAVTKLLNIHGTYVIAKLIIDVRASPSEFWSLVFND